MTVQSGVRGPYQNGIRRRQEIVETAIEIFGEVGYRAGSLRTIAERVGTSPATVVQHFGSKEGLLAAVLQRWSELSEQAVHPAPDQGLSYLRRLDRLMEFHVEHRGLLELFITLTAEATSASHPAHEFIQQRYAQALAMWSAELRRAVQLGQTAPMTEDEIQFETRMIVAMADGLEVQWLLDPRLDLPGMFSAFLEATIARWGPA